MSWVERLVGFPEISPEQVRANLVCSADQRQLTSRVNQRRLGCGRLELPSLGELRAAGVPRGGATWRVGERVSDARALHADPASAGAVFQVASQFNLLEMIHPGVSPEDGVDRYAFDPTQGPACAIACGGATLYRNYFVPVDGRIGQSAAHQLNTLADLEQALAQRLGRPPPLWPMRNGYALPDGEVLREVNTLLAGASASALDAWRACLRVGVVADAEVTLPGAAHAVSQVFCSALPVAYGVGPSAIWEPLARLVLEATYEATLRAALSLGASRVFLTLVGGGAFGNDQRWIVEAAGRALRLLEGAPLSVDFVSFRAPVPALAPLLRG
jgi:hypothetical protein